VVEVLVMLAIQKMLAMEYQVVIQFLVQSLLLEAEAEAVLVQA
jgi:hypothetical protein